MAVKLRVWTPTGPRVVAPRERWTKQCACGFYIPDEYIECDACLFKLAGLDHLVPPCHECDPDGIAEGTFRQDDVASALRSLRASLANV